MAELVGNALAEAGWAVSKRHRELERRAADALHDARKVADA
jgi:UPF0042 nucleotide-binding protein